MKKLIKFALIGFIGLVLILKSISTPLLCGGTFMQNWMGLGSCTESQSQFMGLGYTYFEGTESVGVAVLVIFLLVLIIVGQKWLRKRAG
ncbi:hypothetical protein [Agaribacter flavus]|uniref:Uncharacterized protein n=1 Tax=Agaribacter flavus TaxID=1902781 RepID=A0ABV7FTP3_9ALTE